MSESPNSGDSPTNSKPKIPNTDDFTTKKTNHGEASVSGSGANKGRSCKGCLYYSSQFKSDSRNPLCLGLSRSLPNAPRYIVGTSEMEASKEGMILRDFKYGCVGYSIYADQKNRASDPQQSEPELPVCMGIEVLVDRKIKESLAAFTPNNWCGERGSTLGAITPRRFGEGYCKTQRPASADERTGLGVGVKTRLHDRGSACGFRGPQPQVQSNAGGRCVL
ncbi:uncharacterized protein LOC121775541 isoform X1 [Salvia splendens]|uniref:uncharacterized protein LOC121775541 isoform X1 n=1 Tax=Salvia splendens TaxID=180675 RepID=UPI001C25B1D9|nr:uncharacterized protein LOC121775541 isoform X1 [Salvia splendens]